EAEFPQGGLRRPVSTSRLDLPTRWRRRGVGEHADPTAADAVGFEGMRAYEPPNLARVAVEDRGDAGDLHARARGGRGAVTAIALFFGLVGRGRHGVSPDGLHGSR